MATPPTLMTAHILAGFDYKEQTLRENIESTIDLLEKLQNATPRFTIHGQANINEHGCGNCPPQQRPADTNHVKGYDPETDD